MCRGASWTDAAPALAGPPGRRAGLDLCRRAATRPPPRSPGPAPHRAVRDPARLAARRRVLLPRRPRPAVAHTPARLTPVHPSPTMPATWLGDDPISLPSVAAREGNSGWAHEEDTPSLSGLVFFFRGEDATALRPSVPPTVHLVILPRGRSLARRPADRGLANRRLEEARGSTRHRDGPASSFREDHHCGASRLDPTLDNASTLTR